MIFKDDLNKISGGKIEVHQFVDGRKSYEVYDDFTGDVIVETPDKESALKAYTYYHRRKYGPTYGYGFASAFNRVFPMTGFDNNSDSTGLTSDTER